MLSLPPAAIGASREQLGHCQRMRCQVWFWMMMIMTLAMGNAGALTTVWPWKQYSKRAVWTLSRMARSDSGNNNNNSGSYQFGDITRGILRNIGQQKQQQQQGEKKGYQFGDISRWIDKRAKERVAEFTQKPQYQFGDITKELVIRLQGTNYTSEDVWLLLKIVALVGVQFQPIARLLPTQALLGMLELSVAQHMQSKAAEVISTEVDQRIKNWISTTTTNVMDTMTNTNNNNNNSKELTNESAKKAYLEKTGTSNNSNNSDDEKTLANAQTLLTSLDETAKNDFETWDRTFVASQQNNNNSNKPQQDDEFRKWDQAFLKSSSSDGMDGTKKQA